MYSVALADSLASWIKDVVRVILLLLPHEPNEAMIACQFLLRTHVKIPVLKMMM